MNGNNHNGHNHKGERGIELVIWGKDHKSVDQTRVPAPELKTRPVAPREIRRVDNDNFFSFLDREYIESLDSLERNPSGLSKLIYAIGGTIFVLGVAESLTLPQLIGTSHLSHANLSEIGLIAAFAVGLVFIGFGKGVEIIVHRRRKPPALGDDDSNN